MPVSRSRHKRCCSDIPAAAGTVKPAGPLIQTSDVGSISITARLFVNRLGSEVSNEIDSSWDRFIASMNAVTVRSALLHLPFDGRREPPLRLRVRSQSRAG